MKNVFSLDVWISKEPLTFWLYPAVYKRITRAYVINLMMAKNKTGTVGSSKSENIGAAY